MAPWGSRESFLIISALIVQHVHGFSFLPFQPSPVILYPFCTSQFRTPGHAVLRFVDTDTLSFSKLSLDLEPVSSRSVNQELESLKKSSWSFLGSRSETNLLSSLS